jgi:hypothetical protein
VFIVSDPRNPNNVQAGQLWRSNDKRDRSRRLLINAVDLSAGTATVQNVVGEASEAGRTTTVSLRRFRANSTGYVLLCEAPLSDTPEEPIVRQRIELSNGHMDASLPADVSERTLDALRSVGEAALLLLEDDPRNPYGVAVGQVWRSNDKRDNGRSLKVIDVDLTRGKAQTQSPWSLGSKTWIRLDRFRPTSTGYQLIQNS